VQLSNLTKMPQVLSKEKYSSHQSRCCDQSVSFSKGRVIRSQSRVFIRNDSVNPKSAKKA
jgi:hypothetical protein